MDPFVTAICAEPEDDLPRLIYADWLDDRGDPRGEFIRLQLAERLGQLANLARIVELEKMYGRKWAGPFADWAYMVGFSRGFPEHLVIPADVFMDFADEIFRIAPVRGVSLIGAAKKLRKLVRLPALHHLTALHLTGTLIGDRGVARLANCHHLTNLRTLRLGHCDLTSKGVGHLCESLNFTNVTHIDLADNAIDGAAIVALANSALPGKLRYFDVRNNRLQPVEVDKLKRLLPKECLLLADHTRTRA